MLFRESYLLLPFLISVTLLFLDVIYLPLDQLSLFLHFLTKIRLIFCFNFHHYFCVREKKHLRQSHKKIVWTYLHHFPIRTLLIAVFDHGKRGRESTLWEKIEKLLLLLLTVTNELNAGLKETSGPRARLLPLPRLFKGWISSSSGFLKARRPAHPRARISRAKVAFKGRGAKWGEDVPTTMGSGWSLRGTLWVRKGPIKAMH